MSRESEIQQQYYTQTADIYDDWHVDREHALALHLLAGYIEFYQIKSILDIGAGTGRTILWLKNRFPHLIIVGIEPVEALRIQGYKKGLSSEELREGSVYHLPFADNSFDLVCEFAVLHHLQDPNQAIREMSRVAAQMIGISDCNFVAQGLLPLRLLKYLIFSLGLWPIVNWIKTQGKMYTFTEGDGLAYSYSVYQDLRVLRQFWETLPITATKGISKHHLSSILWADHLLLIGLDKRIVKS